MQQQWSVHETGVSIPQLAKKTRINQLDRRIFRTWYVLFNLGSWIDYRKKLTILFLVIHPPSKVAPPPPALYVPFILLLKHSLLAVAAQSTQLMGCDLYKSPPHSSIL